MLDRRSDAWRVRSRTMDLTILLREEVDCRAGPAAYSTPSAARRACHRSRKAARRTSSARIASTAGRVSLLRDSLPRWQGPAGPAAALGLADFDACRTLESHRANPVGPARWSPVRSCAGFQRAAEPADGEVSAPDRLERGGQVAQEARPEVHQDDVPAVQPAADRDEVAVVDRGGPLDHRREVAGVRGQPGGTVKRAERRAKQGRAGPEAGRLACGAAADLLLLPGQRQAGHDRVGERVILDSRARSLQRAE